MGTGERAALRIDLLGGFAVTVDDEPVADRWRLRKAKTLVKLLALAPRHSMHRDIALEILWPDADLSAGTNNLHQAVHAARRVLGARSVALRDDVLLLAPDDELTIDVDEFQRLADDARGTGDVEDLRAAAQSWTGPLLPEDAYEPWCVPHRERLDEVYAAVASLLAIGFVTADEPDAALAVLEPLAAQRPLDEPVQRARIEALAALGRRWDAIESYEQLRHALDEQYAAEPEQETKALYRRLLTGDTIRAAPPRTNLPAPVSSFIGRQRELRELTAILGHTRLLTLTGPGGAGKTRLALELARRAVGEQRFGDGIWLVELARVKEGELVPTTTASALGLALPAGHPSQQAVTNQLATRALLLVLDNCEHVLAAATALVTDILLRCPNVIVATTSREPLALTGETVYRVPSLELPEATGGELDVAELLELEAVQLFVERARQTSPSFTVDATNAAAVAGICYRLDGMPLALELAAARLAHLSVAELADGLTDALSLLARRGGARLDRQQTLSAALDWSHQLLEVDEQRALRRLAVFAGGFELDAARHVCDTDAVQTVDLISRLVDKSLVEADTSGRATRYRLLEVVRQYADARLIESGDEQQVRRRHREWFAAAAAAHDPDRGSPVVGAPSPWFDVEQDNLRVALTSALAEDPAIALQLATATARFWVTRGLIAEAARWLTAALGRCPDRSAVRARALAAMAVVNVRQGRGGDLVAIGDEIVDLLTEHGDAVDQALARHQRAVLAFTAGKWAQARTEQSVAADRSPLNAVAASAEHLAGLAALSAGDVSTARLRFEAAQSRLTRAPTDIPPYFVALTLAWTVDERSDPPLLLGEDTFLLGRRIGVEQASGHVAIALALTERLSGRVDAALELIDDARARFDALDDRYGQAYAAAQRGHTLCWARDYKAGDDFLAESEALRRSLRDERSVAMSLAGRAIAAAGMGAGDVARRRGLEAVQMMERSGDSAGIALTCTNIGTAELMLGDPHAALPWLGRAADADELPGGQRAYGWARLVQGRLLADLGAVAEAEAAYAFAAACFAKLGEQRGLQAVQRARKERLPSVPPVIRLS
jgi:predicted ATPase/DNA-binding SARP family transcriptional activator